ncbi:hypothetical protein MMC08_009078, partial [Hypocenomyce scalaris]|nr:hypothetical protein [Hypocenomyce scalaris]
MYGLDVQQDYLNGGPTGIPSNGVITGSLFQDVTGTATSDALDYYILCGDGSCSNFNFVDVDIVGRGNESTCNYPRSGCPNSSGTTRSSSATPSPSAKPSPSTKLSSSATPISSSVPAPTTVPEYGQCGGTGYTGSTVCAAGSTCTYSNAYYSQCLATPNEPGVPEY